MTSAEGAASQLEGALAEALSCVRGAVAGTAVMDVALWEVRQAFDHIIIQSSALLLNSHAWGVHDGCGDD